MSTELIVGPLPNILNREDKENFLKLFGAKDVIHLSRKNKEIFTVGRFVL